MDLKLKNIKINEAFSDETTMFQADLCVGKTKIAYCKNNGCGGSTYYLAYPDQRELLEKAEGYCKTLPDIDYGTFQIKSNLENWIDVQIELKKLERDCLKGICYGNEKAYSCLGWKHTTLEKMLQYPTGIKQVKTEVKRLISSGETILNKNLPAEIFIE